MIREPLTILTTLFSFIAGLFSSWVMLICALRVHQFSRRFDDLCESIHKAADLGVEYWLLDSKDGMPALEARIVGHQQLITKSLDSLGAKLRRSERRD